MDKIDQDRPLSQTSAPSPLNLEDDMSVLNYLAQHVHGLQVVSGSFEELGVELGEPGA